MACASTTGRGLPAILVAILLALCACSGQQPGATAGPAADTPVAPSASPVGGVGPCDLLTEVEVAQATGKRFMPAPQQSGTSQFQRCDFTGQPDEKLDQSTGARLQSSLLCDSQKVDEIYAKQDPGADPVSGASADTYIQRQGPKNVVYSRKDNCHLALTGYLVDESRTVGLFLSAYDRLRTPASAPTAAAQAAPAPAGASASGNSVCDLLTREEVESVAPGRYIPKEQTVPGAPMRICEFTFSSTSSPPPSLLLLTHCGLPQADPKDIPGAVAMEGGPSDMRLLSKPNQASLLASKGGCRISLDGSGIPAERLLPLFNTVHERMAA